MMFFINPLPILLLLTAAVAVAIIISHFIK